MAIRADGDRGSSNRQAGDAEPLPWSWGGAGEFVLKTALIIEKSREKRAFPESRFGGTADGGTGQSKWRAKVLGAWELGLCGLSACRTCVRIDRAGAGDAVGRNRLFLQLPPICKTEKGIGRGKFSTPYLVCKPQSGVLEPAKRC